MVKKTCLALVWTTRKLRHYCLANSTKVISQIDPLKYLHQTPSLIGRLSRWLILLTELDLEYVTKKTVKGRAVADFLTLGPLDQNEEVNVEFPDEALAIEPEDEWKMYFDGAVNKNGQGIGIVLVSPNRESFPMAKKLEFSVTNNEAEYEACIFGLQSLLVLGAR